MSELILYPIYAFIGWLYLSIRFRDQRKVRLIVLRVYDNSYGKAGAIIIWQGIAGVLLLAFIVMLLAVFYCILKT